MAVDLVEMEQQHKGGGYQPKLPPYIVPLTAERRVIIDEFEDYIRDTSTKIERIELGQRSYRCTKEIRRCAVDLFSLLEYRMRLSGEQGVKLSYVMLTEKLKWYCQRTVEKAARLLTLLGLIWEPRATADEVGTKCMHWRIPRHAAQEQITAFATTVAQAQKESPSLGNRGNIARKQSSQRRLYALTTGKGQPSSESGTPQPPNHSHSHDSTCEHDVSRVLSPTGTPITHTVRDGNKIPAEETSATITYSVRDGSTTASADSAPITHTVRHPSRTLYGTHHVSDACSLPNKNLYESESESESESDSALSTKGLGETDSSVATPRIQDDAPETRWTLETIEAALWQWCPRLRPLSEREHRHIETQIRIVYEECAALPPEEAVQRLHWTLECLTTERDCGFADKIEAIPFCIGKARNKQSGEEYRLFADIWEKIQRKMARGWLPQSVRRQEEEAFSMESERAACMRLAVAHLKANNVSCEGLSFEELVGLGEPLRRQQIQLFEQEIAQESAEGRRKPSVFMDDAVASPQSQLPITEPSLPVVSIQQDAHWQSEEEVSYQPQYTYEDAAYANEEEYMQEMQQGVQGMNLRVARSLIAEITQRMPLAVLELHRLADNSLIVRLFYSPSETIDFYQPDEWPALYEQRKAQTQQLKARLWAQLQERRQRTVQMQQQSQEGERTRRDTGRMPMRLQKER